MANFAAAAALRARIAAAAPSPSVHTEQPFTDSVWAAEQRIREAIDSLLIPVRWRVVWLPDDGQRRTYYLRGTHAGVTARAHQFFTSGLITIDPAPVQSAPEVFDRRFTSSSHHLLEKP